MLPPAPPNLHRRFGWSRRRKPPACSLSGCAISVGWTHTLRPGRFFPKPAKKPKLAGVPGSWEPIHLVGAPEQPVTPDETAPLWGSAVREASSSWHETKWKHRPSYGADHPDQQEEPFSDPRPG
jgi:hypothetical protein